MPNIDEIYGENKNSIRANDIREGQILECEIANIKTTKFGETVKLVADLKSGQSFVINKTNARRLSEKFGTADFTKWSGRTFGLVRSFTTYQGQEVPCIRVKRSMD